VDVVSIGEAVKRVKTMCEIRSDRSYKGGRKRKGFDQTVDVVLNLGIDPKQADQMIRGSLALPKGIGKSRSVIAFVPEDQAAAAKAAGAVEAGVDSLIEKISGGWMDFDVAIAHPQVMGKVSKLGRVLGPQGKMPSPKTGTVTPNVENAVREYAAGKIEFRNDAGGNVHAAVGKASFPEADLIANIEAFINHIKKVRPASAKGTYIKKVSLSATMTPGVAIEVG
jgi:large subunit ribosomal protein L1